MFYNTLHSYFIFIVLATKEEREKKEERRRNKKERENYHQPSSKDAEMSQQPFVFNSVSAAQS